MVAIREERRPAMGTLTLAERGHRRCGAASRTNLPKRIASSEQDDAVTIPRPARNLTTWQVAHNDWRATRDCDRLQLAVCEEPDRPAVGGPERPARAFRAG